MIDINYMRKKLPEKDRKIKITLTIDEKIIEMLNEYMIDNDFTNKSKLIEKLIKKELYK